jgi:Holliday junction resolvase RusA-like endonuclease
VDSVVRGEGKGVVNIYFEVDGVPKGQPRPRAFGMKRKDGGVAIRVYDPGTAEAWKSAIAVAFRKKFDGLDPKPTLPIVGDVSLRMRFMFQRPKSHYRTGQHSAELRPDAPDWHTSKPDLDNLVKAVMDALTNIGIWRDDSQVAFMEAAKWWSSLGGAAISVNVAEKQGDKA